MENERIEVSGITSESVKTIGTVQLTLDFERCYRKYKMHVVNDSFPIPTDGILGSDFF